MDTLAVALLLPALLFLTCRAYAPKRTIPLKIMSYNIRHGEGLDGVLELSRAAGIIRAQAPDWCALQEIDNGCTRSGRVDQTEFLAKATSMTGVFGAFMSYQGGEYGMATLSARPVLSTTPVTLPDGLHEPRSALVQEVQLADACTIALVNVHFDWIGGEQGQASRMRQARALVAFVDSLGRATVIVGDFNCTPDSPTMQYLATQGFVFVPKGKDRLSFQGTEPAEIDHVIYRPSATIRFREKRITLLHEPIVSDHRPLVAELEVIL